MPYLNRVSRSFPSPLARLFLLSVALCGVLVPGNPALAKEGAEKDKQQQTANQPPTDNPWASLDEETTKAMNALTARASKAALDTIKEHGWFYPFAIVMNNQGAASFLAWSGDEDEEAPPVEEWTKGLLVSLQKIADQQPEIVAATLVRLHEAKKEDGSTIPGIWALTDHRDAPPVVVFFGFEKDEDGNHQIQPPTNFPSKNRIFVDFKE